MASTATLICDAQSSLASCSTHPGFRKDLRKFLLRHRADGAGVVEDDRAGAGGALVERKDERHGQGVYNERPSENGRLAKVRLKPDTPYGSDTRASPDAICCQEVRCRAVSFGKCSRSSWERLF